MAAAIVRALERLYCAGVAGWISLISRSNTVYLLAWHPLMVFAASQFSIVVWILARLPHVLGVAKVITRFRKHKNILMRRCWTPGAAAQN